jgi:hypothetical protein
MTSSAPGAAMMTNNPRLLAMALGLALLAAPLSARADIVLYTLPGTEAQMVLQGSTTVNPGGTITFTHSKFGKIYFKLGETEIKKVPTLGSQFQKQLGRAGATADARMKAADWALKHGMLPQFYEAVEKALDADPQHQRATLVKKLREKMSAPIADSSQQEKELRQLVNRPEMKIKTSKHFMLLHDTPDRPAPNRRVPRADERLQLLEQVYESFLLRFYAHGVELTIPTERMKVVLFNDQKDYLYFATRLSPTLSSAAGFWDPNNNTSVFYDGGSTEGAKSMKRLNDLLQQMKKDAQKARGPNSADIVRTADSFGYVIEIAKENQDITVVSHEATHQMAGNTGLFPRFVRVPSWVHEGLASYFETPDGAAWGGIGAVNKQRLQWYRALEPDKVHSNIDFIVGDQIFDYAGSHASTLHGYAQAWALTHFCMERHFPEFIQFYRRLGEMPPDVIISQDVLTELFHTTVGDASKLDAEWRIYMRSLKTDLERVLEDS